MKSEEQLEETYEDRENVKYQIRDELNVKISKLQVEFDTSKIQLFRVYLTPNDQKIQQFLL